ncbi:MAG: hypothetical protein RBS16_00070 [Candidatus Cloacimonadales bacterium]|nr:hypothetical protein [Candidatus Cloacimonadota bacterium]MDD2650782.1 hypothetical protein [Candidatus Cloacimonadota bacterium]MDX9976411.1 hypothetical protein [Candidatus Cloacimonadales bacterium]
MKIQEIYRQISKLESITDKEILILQELKVKRYDNDFMDMEPFLHMMIEWESKLSDELSLAYVFDGLSAIYFYKDMYDLSLEFSFKALEIADKKMDNYLLAVSLNLIGLIYYRMENIELAEKHFLRSAHVNPNFANVLCNLGLLYYKQEEYEKAKYYMLLGFDSYKDKEELVISGTGFYHKAIIEYCNNAYLKSIEYLDKALEQVEIKNDTYLLMSILIEKARIHKELKDTEKAKELLIEAVNVSNRFSRISLLAKAYYQLSEILKNEGNYKLAYEYLTRVCELEEQIISKEKTARLSEIQSKYNFINANQGMVQLINQSPRLTSIGIISSGIVHEIKQPLSAVKISCESVLYWYRRNLGAIPEIIVEQLKDISTSVNYVNKIIEQIRSFWKTDSLARDTERVELNEFMSEKITMIKNRLQAKDVFIEFIPINKDIISIINKNCFEQIILYLINICFMIISENSTNHDQKLIIETDHNLEYNTIKVSFDGQLKNSLTEIMAKTSQKDNFNGLLLDLEISKYFINQYNGYITFANEPSPYFLVAIPGKVD